MAEKAQVGDLIRVVNAEPLEKGAYKEGDIFEVDERSIGGVIVCDYFGKSRALLDHEYVIHRKAGEEDAPGITTEHFDGTASVSDTVDHPSHYTQGRFETIEIIEEITQGYSDGFVATCVGNALKYLARAPFKHESPAEDLAKAEAYIRFALNRINGSKR